MAVPLTPRPLQTAEVAQTYLREWSSPCPQTLAALLWPSLAALAGLNHEHWSWQAMVPDPLGLAHSAEDKIVLDTSGARHMKATGNSLVLTASRERPSTTPTPVDRRASTPLRMEGAQTQPEGRYF